MLKKVKYLILFTGLFAFSCGQINEKAEKIRKDAEALKLKIDSTQAALDSGFKELDSLMYRIKKDSAEIDSLMKKMNPLK